MICIIDMEDKDKMPISRKGIHLLLAGLLVMFAGFILMVGGGSNDPQVFNYDAIFGFRRLVAAPIVIVAGVVVCVIAIMHKDASEKEDKQ